MKTHDLADYLRRFDYDERVAMKIQLAEMLTLYAQGKAQLVDIRFREEHAAWQIGIACTSRSTSCRTGSTSSTATRPS